MQQLLNATEPNLLVIENQQGLPYNLYLTQKHLNSIAARQLVIATFTRNLINTC